MEELVGLVDLPDRLFQWSLEIATGEVYPGPDDSAQLVPLPQLTETQILDWMGQFAIRANEPRIRNLLAEALRYPAPKARFREVLSVNPPALREWDAYFDQKRRSILLAWLGSLGIEPGHQAAESYTDGQQAIADPKNKHRAQARVWSANTEDDHGRGS